MSAAASAAAVRSIAAGSRAGVEMLDGAAASERAARVRPPDGPSGWVSRSIGTSVEGRSIDVWHTQPVGALRQVTIVCGIHGDERGALDLADVFSRADRPADMAVTIVPLANPDGWIAGARRNAERVDLNRNFPVAWYGGDGAGDKPASEPETQALMWLLATTRPDLTIWVHQPLGYVAGLSTCPDQYVETWAAEVASATRPHLFQWGGGETWTAMKLVLPSMLVEVDGDDVESTHIGVNGAALAATMKIVDPVA